MKARTIRIMTYVSGLLTGIILTLIVALCVANHRHDRAMKEQDNALAMEEIEESDAAFEMDDPYYEARKYEETTLFSRPRETFKAVEAVVYQVLPSGNARAALRDKEGVLKRVVLLAKEGNEYYDQQEITIPPDKRVRVVGTCRYGESTLPVVDILDK